MGKAVDGTSRPADRWRRPVNRVVEIGRSTDSNYGEGEPQTHARKKHRILIKHCQQFVNMDHLSG